jgi:hypothetical protein
VEFLLKHYKLKRQDEEEDPASPREEPEEHEEEWLQCQKDALDISNDFVTTTLDDNCMEIARYYGIQEFLVLVPARTLMDETRIKILLSSLTIATNNANW